MRAVDVPGVHEAVAGGGKDKALAEPAALVEDGSAAVAHQLLDDFAVRNVEDVEIAVVVGGENVCTVEGTHLHTGGRKVRYCGTAVELQDETVTTVVASLRSRAMSKLCAKISFGCCIQGTGGRTVARRALRQTPQTGVASGENCNPPSREARGPASCYK